MLKTRLITALIAIPLTVGLILVLPLKPLVLLYAAVCVIAAWEWTVLAGLTNITSKFAYVVVLATTLTVLTFLPLEQTTAGMVMVLTVLGWVACMFWLSFGQVQLPRGQFGVILKTLAGLVLLVTAWLALYLLSAGSEYGAYMTLYLFVLVWLADTAAYFSGRKYGRTPLAPGISPAKSLEGVYGALGVVLVFALTTGMIIGLAAWDWLALVVLSLVTMLFSVVGDLTESLFKRQAGVKDSGTLFPGHGGVLDRIDSLLAAAPFYVVGVKWLGLDA